MAVMNPAREPTTLVNRNYCSATIIWSGAEPSRADGARRWRTGLGPAVRWRIGPERPARFAIERAQRTNCLWPTLGQLADHQGLRASRKREEQAGRQCLTALASGLTRAL